MAGDDDMIKRNSTPFSRIVNPELYAKPNPKLAFLGTAVFLAVTAHLLWQKYTYEKQQKRRSQDLPNNKGSNNSKSLEKT